MIYPNYLTFLTYQRYSTIEYIVPGKERYKAIPPTAFNDDLLPLLCLMMTKSRITPTMFNDIKKQRGKKINS